MQRFDPRARLEKNPKAVQRVLAQLREYFAGDRSSFNLPVDISLTPFQPERSRRGLPYRARPGLDLSSGCGRVGSPRSSRPVGGALARNPIPIVIPCHRVAPATAVWAAIAVDRDSRPNDGCFDWKGLCSAASCSGGIGVSRLSAGNLVGANRCLFDLGFDLSRDPLCRRDHSPIFDGRRSLHHLRRISFAPFQGDPRPEAVNGAQRSSASSSVGAARRRPRGRTVMTIGIMAASAQPFRPGWLHRFRPAGQRPGCAAVYTSSAS